MLIDGAFFGWNGIGTVQFLIQETVILYKDPQFFIFRQIHTVDDVAPAFSLFLLAEVGDTAYTRIFVGVFSGNNFKIVKCHPQALHTRVIGVPVIIYVVLVLIRSGDTQYHIFLFWFGERYTLAPETGDGDHYFQSVFGYIIFATRDCSMLCNGIDDDIIAMYFFKGNFPFTVAFLTAVSNLREEGGTLFETQFAGILYRFRQLVITVYQQVFYNLPRSRE